MNLHYHLRPAQTTAHFPVMLLHGLFGSLDNLSTLGRSLQQESSVIQIDLRNHGLSPHSPEMNYAAMAQGVLALLDQLSIEKIIIIGHSMGGKVAMALTAIAASRIDRLIIIDIAPAAYQNLRHDAIFFALNAVTEAGITQRQQAAELMRRTIEQEAVIAFLLKSFDNGAWRFNLPVLMNQYDTITGWKELPAWPGPVLFIRGELSPYIQNSHFDGIARQFPHARIDVIEGCSHWVHAEKPASVLRAVQHLMPTTLSSSARRATP